MDEVLIRDLIQLSQASHWSTDLYFENTVMKYVDLN